MRRRQTLRELPLIWVWFKVSGSMKASRYRSCPGSQTDGGSVRLSGEVFQTTSREASAQTYLMSLSNGFVALKEVNWTGFYKLEGEGNSILQVLLLGYWSGFWCGMLRMHILSVTEFHSCKCYQNQ
ncbi:hypothetical protein CFP56_008255 [Quercus suber]|uniref:Uncharacterized protein n=1 Tax=Quercus suber TaxID=58331 RepID=A0AAW0L5G4_QUESU